MHALNLREALKATLPDDPNTDNNTEFRLLQRVLGDLHARSRVRSLRFVPASATGSGADSYIETGPCIASLYLLQCQRIEPSLYREGWFALVACRLPVRAQLPSRIFVRA